MRTTDLSHDLNELAIHMRENSERWFPILHNGVQDMTVFYTLGLVGEAGELANIVKKGVRAVGYEPETLSAELADIFTYLNLLANELGIDLISAYQAKEAVCEARWG